MKRTGFKKKPTKPLKRTKLAKCKECNSKFIFKIYKSNLKSNHKGVYCSMNCYTIARKKIAFNFSCIICSKVVFTQPAQIKYRNRSTCSIECRSKYTRIKAEKRRKELGYTKHQLDRLARYSPENVKWRKAVFERDNYTCQICFIRGTSLEADHIKPWAYFPELRFDLSNGRTLCKSCHNITKIGYKKMRELYEKNKIK